MQRIEGGCNHTDPCDSPGYHLARVIRELELERDSWRDKCHEEFNAHSREVQNLRNHIDELEQKLLLRAEADPLVKRILTLEAENYRLRRQNVLDVTDRAKGPYPESWS